ncbi:MAG TPA: UDP-N-acetylmuramate--L-alanine ligase [Gemmatimonadota bacterium]|nr:UDP-N-acetylmuramate--L-alanine ligase [Gemmatimonadota bacterium]
MRYPGLTRLAEKGAAIHLMGIGGAGMAGLARVLQTRGAQVSGCDRESSETTRELEKSGIAVMLGHAADHCDKCAALVHTAAVPHAHPELQAARAKGVPVLKRSGALAEVVSAGDLVAVSGTHGKTTTTALTAMALEAAGRDPTALVGGRVAAWRGNARIGRSDLYVVEADEYDRSFLALWPKIAVVTSVETDHFETYTTLADLEAAFDEFVDRVPASGRVIACVDDMGARRRLSKAGSRGLSYGLGRDAELRAVTVGYGSGTTRFSAEWRGDSLGDFQLGLRGHHNVRNALAVLGVLLALDLDPREAAPALADFVGVERRFQVIGEAGGVTVIDDYAHHPTEVAATLETARRTYSGRRLVVAFQPHLYSRTEAFAREFGRALAFANVVWVTAIYPAREEPIPGVTAELVAEAARDEMDADAVHLVGDLAELQTAVKNELRAGDVFMTLGAGDVFQVARDLAAELERSHVDA